MRKPASFVLVASAALLTIAPLFMPPSYRWVEHTTSESAAQGIPGAWVARTGFAFFALGVAIQAWSHRRRWNPLTVGAHAGFSVCMLGAATFSTRPWFVAAYDATEDSLHSVAASVMGFCFALGVVSSLFDRTGARRSIRLVDALAIGASVLVPIAMFSLGIGAGLLQRAMFAIALWWYIDVRETGAVARDNRDVTSQRNHAVRLDEVSAGPPDSRYPGSPDTLL